MSDQHAAARQSLIRPEGIFDQVARRQTLSDMLVRTAERHPDKTAIICGDDRWTYADFDRRVSRLAAGLMNRGLVPGDRIAVLAYNSHWYAVARFAIARMGGVFVPINFMLGVEEIAYILDHARPSLLFVDSQCSKNGVAAAQSAGVEALCGLPGETGGLTVDGLPAIADLMPEDIDSGILPPISSHAIAQIIYTSGTESRPKGAMLSHEAILLQYQSVIHALEHVADTIHLHALPMFHCAQLDAMLGPAIQVGATNVIVSRAAPDIVLPAIERHGINRVFAPPTVWISLLRSPLFDRTDLRSLTHGAYGASIMPVEVMKEIRRRIPGIRLWNLYGQTEIAPVSTVLLPEEHDERPASAGRPVLNVQMRVVDDAMRDVPAGGVGEVVYRSPQLLVGYWRDADKTAEAFSGGWFHSGDLAMIDAQGYIQIVDRKKDMIKTGGENVASREVEEILYTHEAVSEVAVIGLPDEKWIEVVTAFVVLKDGMALNEADVIAHCRESLAGFKVPKHVLFVEGMPRNASGKILKRTLREHGVAALAE